jgi:hypothetical protein
LDVQAENKRIKMKTKEIFIFSSVEVLTFEVLMLCS